MIENGHMNWNGSVVALSIAIAFVGAYCTVTLYEQFRLSSRENVSKYLTPNIITILMAVSLGGVSIWTMHFVAMQSFALFDSEGNKIDIHYRVDLSIVSLLVVLLMCYIGLKIGTHDRLFTKDQTDLIEKFKTDARNLTIQEIRSIRSKQIFVLSSLFRNSSLLLMSGIVTSAGVCVMHYIGMQAIVFPGHIVWDIGIVAASCIIAMIAATAAFWIMFRLLSMFPNFELLRVICSLVASIAVNGMHYCGQAAATFVLDSNANTNINEANVMNQNSATIVAVVVSAAFVIVVFIIVISDLRFWYHKSLRIVREADIRMTLALQNPLTKDEMFLKAYEKIRASKKETFGVVRMEGVNSNGSSEDRSSGATFIDSTRQLNVSTLQVAPKYTKTHSENGVEEDGSQLVSLSSSKC